MDGMPEVGSAFRRDRDGKTLILRDRTQTQLPVARFEQYGLMQFNRESAGDQFSQSTQCFGINAARTSSRTSFIGVPPSGRVPGTPGLPGKGRRSTPARE